MKYRITIQGTSPLIQHDGTAGLDTTSPANIEKAKLTAKRKRTEIENARIRELETITSLWLDEDGAPTIRETALRAAIETAARSLKQGPLVRGGLIVNDVEDFVYDRTLGTTADELAKTVQFSAAVVVQRQRIMRTRARFEEWACTFVVEVDDELVNAEHLETWLDIAGRRIGLGDWRPEKSGVHGRFKTISITAL